MQIQTQTFLFIVSFLSLVNEALAQDWDLWIHKGEPEPDFYNMQHYTLEIMPAGLLSHGYLLDAPLKNNGLEYRRRKRYPYQHMGKGTKLLVRGISEAQKTTLLQKFDSQALPNPAGVPHQNCQDFIKNLIDAAGLANVIPQAKRVNYAVEESKKPDNTLPNVGTATTPGKYFAHTNNFEDPRGPDTIYRWTFPGADGASESDETEEQTVQRRAPQKGGKKTRVQSQKIHFSVGVKSTGPPPNTAEKCPAGQKPQTKQDPKTKKMVPVTKVDPKTKKTVPVCVPANTQTPPGTKTPGGKKTPGEKKPVKNPSVKKPVTKAPGTKRPKGVRRPKA